jgi:hypothetical protein
MKIINNSILAMAIIASIRNSNTPVYSYNINSEPIKKSKKPSGAAKARRAKKKGK